MLTHMELVCLMHKFMFSIVVCLFNNIFADVLWLVEYMHISTLTNLETLATHKRASFTYPVNKCDKQCYNLFNLHFPIL